MNAIFSAQRAGVVVDAVVMADADSGFLQQASHLTGVTWQRGSQRKSVPLLVSPSYAPSFLFDFLPSPIILSHLSFSCHQLHTKAGTLAPACCALCLCTVPNSESLNTCCFHNQQNYGQSLCNPAIKTSARSLQLRPAGGLYLRPRDRNGLLQYLLSLFSADTHTRSMLSTVRHGNVDFRASCFCHKKPIDRGWVCSVCLSIFCERAPECSTCGTAFRAKKAHGRAWAAAAPVLGGKHSAGANGS